MIHADGRRGRTSQVITIQALCGSETAMGERSTYHLAMYLFVLSLNIIKTMQLIGEPSPFLLVKNVLKYLEMTVINRK